VDFCQYSSVRSVSSQASNAFPFPPYHGFSILVVSLKNYRAPKINHTCMILKSQQN